MNLISDEAALLILVIFVGYVLVVCAVFIACLWAIFRKKPGLRLGGIVLLVLWVGVLVGPWALDRMSHALWAYRMTQALILPEDIDLSGEHVVFAAVGDDDRGVKHIFPRSDGDFDRAEDMAQAVYAYLDAASVLVADIGEIGLADDASQLWADPVAVWHPLIGPPENYWEPLLQPIPRLQTPPDTVVLLLSRPHPAFDQVLSREGIDAALAEKVSRMVVFYETAEDGAATQARLLQGSMSIRTPFLPFIRDIVPLVDGLRYQSALARWLCDDAPPVYPGVICSGLF